MDPIDELLSKWSEEIENLRSAERTAARERNAEWRAECYVNAAKLERCRDQLTLARMKQRKRP